MRGENQVPAKNSKAGTDEILTAEGLAKGFMAALGAAGGPNPMQSEFLRQAFDDYEADETPEVGPGDLACVLAAFWLLGEKRRTGDAPRIDITPVLSCEGEALGYDAIQVIQDDAPFLVDSVMGDLAAAGVSVRAMFHPLLETGRDKSGARIPADGRESMILVMVDTLPPERRSAVAASLAETLADVRSAVADHGAMTALMRRCMEDLKQNAPAMDADALEESLAFLRWMNDDHFVFLGAREYEFPRTKDGAYEAEAPLSQSGEGLGVLRDPGRRVLRQASEPAVLTRQMRRQMDLGEPVSVAKANLRSRVHRRAYMDYVGVKRYGADGMAAGETRFVGLFTAEAYDRAASDVPLIRRKVKTALEGAGKAPGSHNHKRLRNILENYPRDELFQMSESELLEIALGVLHLLDRPRVKIFARKDPFDRFVSVLVYVPRERYDAGVRERIGRILAAAWGGRVSAWYPQLSDAPLVRLHYIIGVEPGDHLDPNLADVESMVVDTSRSWSDRFENAARRAGVAEAQISALTAKWSEAFGPGYRDRYDAIEAVTDLFEFDVLGDEGQAPVAVRAFRLPEDTPLQFRFKLYRRGDPAPLSDVLPILADMGLKTLEEHGHSLKPLGDTPVHVHEFLLEDPRGETLNFSDMKTPFEDAFTAVWTGRAESDGFNRLVIELGVHWREAALIRTLARYRQQTGIDPSQSVQEEALREYPRVARALLSLFHAKFDPAAGPAEGREPAVLELTEMIDQALREVASLEHDRALRRLSLLIQAIKRTNYYQTAETGEPKPYIAIKIASRELDDLPAPKPYREIFVCAPYVEGSHLRFGPVARGGLRWSDRRDDYRTEVLGLVKAQQVKNAVIVPVGSKGGFYPKYVTQMRAAGADRDAIQAEAIRAYKAFLSGLLDLTDNIAASGAVVRQPAVVAWEGDDPYMVVAADKGTATFSDIANGVAADYGFWLGDAFASGGSAGYDHKEMGITARGAWEAVKRHFRELGKDIQSEPFTVAGVGDMSGDVFGNGMLLSKQTRLIAAFDHRDIFIDPDPDPATSWKERKRLFELPRSSWQDYDKSKISKGGGVFPRSSKSISLTPEIKAALDIEADELDPFSLIQAVLKAPTELLYFGGIGTYVKAAHETDLQVGDKANDAIRVNGSDLRVQVVGEGANLGMTQAGRIAFARTGGRINTDAIDNSAGVDSSDHEVNIKILTGAAIASGELKEKDRNDLLASMTEDVARKVLVHNYDQTLALSLQERNAPAELDAQIRFMRRLEAQSRLDRTVEGLPNDARLAEMRAAGLGLTRPELAVLMAYSKLELSDDIEASQAPEDPFFERVLKDYFPEALGKFDKAMNTHRLRREIVATVLGNDMINMCGATFPQRLRVSAQCDTTALAIAFEAARRVFRLDEAWDAVSALDGRVSAEAQLRLYQEIALVLRRQTFWLARRASRKKDGGVGDLIKTYRQTADDLRAAGGSVLSRFEQARLKERKEAFVEAGAPRELAKSIALMRPTVAASDISDLAREATWSAPSMARLYHQVGAAFELDRLRAAAGSLASSDHYERLAVRRMVEDFMTEQAIITRAVAKSCEQSAGESERAAEAAVDAWVGDDRQGMAEDVRRAVDEIEQSGQGWSFAKLTIANVAVRDFAAAAQSRAPDRKN